MKKPRWNPAIWLAAIVSLTVLWTSPVSAATDPVSSWNTVAAQATLTAGQIGAVSSRTLAIVHVAIHDALNAIDSRYERYAFTGIAPQGASVDAAIASAAWNAIVGAVGVGLLPIPNFGPPNLQAAALAQAHAK